jgi:stage V sporulation protein D (sporulation-specific penicillin-binding protein)
MITDVYEPGSTFKIFTMSAYLKKFPNVDDEKTFCGNGKQVFQFGKYTRTVHDHEKHGWLTHTEIIKVSSNIGIVDLAQKLQPDDLYQEYIKYGFGTKTGVDMPGEVAGMLRPVKDWDQVTMTTIPYGQEISVTALQLIRAYAAVANGGCMVEPYVVEKIEKNGRNLYSHSGQKNCGIVDNIRRLKLVSMLESVVQKGGSGTKAFIPGYNIAGKTGTAQVHNPNGKGYLADKYVASFIGFMPADKPEAVTLVIVNQPAGGLYFGGDVAAPIFKRLNTMMASYFKVSQPEVQNEFVPGATLVAVKDSKMPELKGKKLNDVRALLAAAGIKYKGCGAGNMIIGQDPEAGKKVKQGDSVVLYLAASGAGGAVKYYMPDVRGLTVRRTVEVLAIFGLKANCSGNGFAVSQDPKPGTAVEKGRECAVNFVMKEN